MCMSENSVTGDKGLAGNSERKKENPWCKKWGRERGRPRHSSRTNRPAPRLPLTTVLIWHIMTHHTRLVRSQNVWNGHNDVKAWTQDAPMKQVKKNLPLPTVYGRTSTQYTHTIHTQINAPSLPSYAGLNAPLIQGLPPALRRTASWDAIVSLFRLVFNPVN